MMSSSRSRYSGMREVYFGNTRPPPPPVPPKQDTNGARHSSPSLSPHHQRRGSPGNILTGHYTQYSHSVPRSHSKPTNINQVGIVRDVNKAVGQSVARSSSFSHSHEAPPTFLEAPPTLPPRPVPTPVTTFKRAQPKFVTDDLTFEELITHYQKQFPLRVYITNGYLGATSRLTISTGDMYNIHFLKRARVMQFKDRHDIPYSIPLNSAIEFGLLYQPKDGRQATEIEIGVVFSSVSDLLSQHELPKVVCVKKSWQSNDNKTSLVTNEVLFIKSVQRSLFTKKGIRLVSLTTKSDKFLTEDCSANFTTQPSLCKLHITDIIEHIKQPKGEQCLLFINSQVYINRELDSSPGIQSLPDELFDKVLTIIEQVTETSLIASSMIHRRLEVTPEDFDPDKDVLFDIPVDENTAEMTCVLVDIPDTIDTDRLYEDTKALYEKFDPTKVMSIKDSGGSEDTQISQKLLYTTIRRGCEGLGVEIDRPDTIYDSIPSSHDRRLEEKLPSPPTPPPSITSSPTPPPPPRSSLIPPSPLTTDIITPPQSTSPRLPSRSLQSRDHTDIMEESDEYDEVTSESLRLIHHRSNHFTTSPNITGRQDDNKLTLKVDELQQQLQQSQSQVASLHSKLDLSMRHLSELENEVDRMKSTVEKLLPQIYALQSNLTHVTTSPQKENNPDDGERSKVKGDGTLLVEENMKYLQTLTTQQVSQLLDAMELGQYRDSFSKENVCGEILLECDNEILKSDLGMVSRLHRVRIMKVIDGRHSAAALIEGVDPYVTLGTK